MSDTTPEEPIEPPAPAPQQDVLADVHHPVGSAYDPMPLEVSDAQARNWMGIVALVFGIIGGSVIAIVFGILGLSAAKKGKATNRGMSIWGIVLGAMWLVLSIVATALLVVFVANATSTEAAAGDCYVSVATTEGDLFGDSPVIIACSPLANSEVYYVAAFDGASAPGGATFADDVLTFCTTEAAIANVDTDIAADYYLETYVPNSAAWDSEPHTVVCGITTGAGPIDDGAVLND